MYNWEYLLIPQNYEDFGQQNTPFLIDSYANFSEIRSKYSLNPLIFTEKEEKETNMDRLQFNNTSFQNYLILNRKWLPPTIHLPSSSTSKEENDKK